MINFVIVEDNGLYAEKVYNMILSYMMNNKSEFKITKFNDYNKELTDFINNHKGFNIYILDFELPSATAVDIAKEIRENDWTSPIIILTAYPSLALETFKKRLQILDFVSKQMDAEKNIHELLDICMKMINKDKIYRYTYNNIEQNIPISSILYVIRDGRRIAIVTDETTYYQNISIKNIKKLLTKDFVYSSKGVIINMKRLKALNWNKMSVIFDNNNEYSFLSKSHRKELDEYEYI